ncbi:MAG TPA: GFA family protein [Solirubrobacterales bacterium]|jgi:hypothetical protein
MSDSSPAPTAIAGGCNCGAVRFEVSAPLLGGLACWCRRCQRRTGAAGGPNARTEPGSFRLLGDQTALGVWDPGDGGWEKVFCLRCGSQICSRAPGEPDQVSVRFGAFDEEPGVPIAAHQFVAYAAPWGQPPDDGVPRYPERAPAAGSARSRLT